MENVQIKKFELLDNYHQVVINNFNEKIAENLENCEYVIMSDKSLKVYIKDTGLIDKFKKYNTLISEKEVTGLSIYGIGIKSDPKALAAISEYLFDKNYELVDIFTGETKIVFFITKMNLKDDLLHLKDVLHREGFDVI
jgi:aspartokinase